MGMVGLKNAWEVGGRGILGHVYRQKKKSSLRKNTKDTKERKERLMEQSICKEASRDMQKDGLALEKTIQKE